MQRTGYVYRAVVTGLGGVGSFATSVVLALLVLSMIGAGCTSSDELTESQMQKLSPFLQQQINAEGQGSDRIWPVTVKTASVQDLRDANLPLATVTEGIVTARWTMKQIRDAAQISSVSAISSTENRPMSPSNSPDSSA
ncbi:hypothetical protein CRI94_06855 [Longibacter salinarum]|uniref:Uncharacterized protein n=1 Tax=Longibacter salinarum TaxID=1850348 RepID=A0A2A8CYI8_9BACT|nr:hypothetical protein CRI94_06855 [Longibacter salinarum]